MARNKNSKYTIQIGLFQPCTIQTIWFSSTHVIWVNFNLYTKVFLSPFFAEQRKLSRASLTEATSCYLPDLSISSLPSTLSPNPREAGLGLVLANLGYFGGFFFLSFFFFLLLLLAKAFLYSPSVFRGAAGLSQLYQGHYKFNYLSTLFFFLCLAVRSLGKTRVLYIDLKVINGIICGFCIIWTYRSMWLVYKDNFLLTSQEPKTKTLQIVFP